MFGPRNSAYAFLDMTDIPTYIYISREILIEYPSVGLTSLAQLHVFIIAEHTRFITTTKTYDTITRKMVPITGQVSSFFEYFLYVR